jgi:hypothetical protein
MQNNFKNVDFQFILSLPIILNFSVMIHYMYPEKEIIAIMQFPGFTRQESIGYLDELRERGNDYFIS